jgi:hypothetical protein
VNIALLSSKLDRYERLYYMNDKNNSPGLVATASSVSGRDVITSHTAVSVPSLVSKIYEQCFTMRLLNITTHTYPRRWRHLRYCKTPMKMT